MSQRKAPSGSPIYSPMVNGEKAGYNTVPRAHTKSSPSAPSSSAAHAKDDADVSYGQEIRNEKAKLEEELASLKKHDELQSLKQFMDKLQKSPVPPTDKEIRLLSERLEQLDSQYQHIDDLHADSEDEQQQPVERRIEFATEEMNLPGASMEEDDVPNWTVVRHTPSKDVKSEVKPAEIAVPKTIEEANSMLQDLTNQMEELEQIQNHIEKMQSMLSNARGDEEEEEEEPEIQPVDNDKDSVDSNKTTKELYDRWLSTAKGLEAALGVDTRSDRDIQVNHSNFSNVDSSSHEQERDSREKDYSTIAQDGSDSGIVGKKHSKRSVARTPLKERDDLCEEINACIDFYVRSHSKPAVRLMHIMIQHLAALPEIALADALRLISAYSIHTQKNDNGTDSGEADDALGSTVILHKNIRVAVPESKVPDESKRCVCGGDLVQELQSSCRCGCTCEGKCCQKASASKPKQFASPQIKESTTAKHTPATQIKVSVPKSEPKPSTYATQPDSEGLAELKQKLNFRFPHSHGKDVAKSYDYAESVSSASSALKDKERSGKMNRNEVEDILDVGGDVGEDWEEYDEVEDEVDDRVANQSDTSSLAKETTERVQRQFQYVGEVLHDLAAEFNQLIPEDSDVDDDEAVKDVKRMDRAADKIGNLVCQKTGSGPVVKARIMSAMKQFDRFGGKSGLTYCKLIHVVMTILLDELVGGDDVQVDETVARELQIKGTGIKLSDQQYEADFDE